MPEAAPLMAKIWPVMNAMVVVVETRDKGMVEVFERDSGVSGVSLMFDSSYHTSPGSRTESRNIFEFCNMSLRERAN
jgi:hypothetical protein